MDEPEVKKKIKNQEKGISITVNMAIGEEEVVTEEEKMEEHKEEKKEEKREIFVENFVNTEQFPVYAESDEDDIEPLI